MFAFSFFDKKLQEFSTPYFAENLETFIRSFGDVLLEGKAPLMARHPHDFALYQVGKLDLSEQSFAFDTFTPPMKICELVDFPVFKQVEKNDNGQEQTSSVGDEAPVCAGSECEDSAK